LFLFRHDRTFKVGKANPQLADFFVGEVGARKQLFGGFAKFFHHGQGLNFSRAKKSLTSYLRYSTSKN
jgi:hypothetical protein